MLNEIHRHDGFLVSRGDARYFIETVARVLAQYTGEQLRELALGFDYYRLGDAFVSPGFDGNVKLDPKTSADLDEYLSRDCVACTVFKIADKMRIYVSKDLRGENTFLTFKPEDYSNKSYILSKELLIRAISVLFKYRPGYVGSGYWVNVTEISESKYATFDLSKYLHPVYADKMASALNIALHNSPHWSYASEGYSTLPGHVTVFPEVHNKGKETKGELGLRLFPYNNEFVHIESIERQAHISALFPLSAAHLRFNFELTGNGQYRAVCFGEEAKRFRALADKTALEIFHTNTEKCSTVVRGKGENELPVHLL